MKTSLSPVLKYDPGFWQLCSEMVACQSMNCDLTTFVYGALTDGFYWVFAKLSNNLTQDSREINPFKMMKMVSLFAL